MTYELPRLNLQPNFEDAARFVSRLFGCEAEEAWHHDATWQTYDDHRTRGGPKGLDHVLHGSLEEHSLRFRRLNEAGAAIAIAVNSTDLMGRGLDHLRGRRAWVADLDPGGAVIHPSRAVYPLPPTCLVDSGHGIHAYWIATDCLPFASKADIENYANELRGIQKALARYGADPKVCDPSRAMRLPGTWNRKYSTSVITKLLYWEGPTYTREQIVQAFPPEEPIRKWISGFKGCHLSQTSTHGLCERARAYARVLAMRDPAISGANGHSTTLRAAILIACGFDLDEDSAFATLNEVYNPMCIPPWEEEALRRKVREAIRICPDRGWLNSGKGSR